MKFSALLVFLYVFYQIPVYSATSLSSEYFKCSVHIQKEFSQMVWKYLLPGSVMHISILLTQTNLILLGKCTQTREYAHGDCVVPSLSHLIAHGRLLQGEVPILQGLIRGNKGEIFVHHFKSPFIPWLCFSQERLSYQAEILHQYWDAFHQLWVVRNLGAFLRWSWCLKTNYLIIFIWLRYLLEVKVLL